MILVAIYNTILSMGPYYTTLNQNVQKLPDKPPEEKPKKYSFGLLVAILASLFGSFIWWVNKSSA